MTPLLTVILVLPAILEVVFLVNVLPHRNRHGSLILPEMNRAAAARIRAMVMMVATIPAMVEEVIRVTAVVVIQAVAIRAMVEAARRAVVATMAVVVVVE
jgi:hypothetical protein